MRTRTDVINEVIRLTGARTYLEIGVRNPDDNFHRIEALYRIGLDPALLPASGPGWGIEPIRSLEYWLAFPDAIFDVIFIDGDHSFGGAHADLLTWPRRARCAVVVHDVLPGGPAEVGDVKPDNGHPWSGNVWQAWAAFRRTSRWATAALKLDHGLGIIDVRRPGPDVLPAWLVPATVEEYRGKAELYAGLIPGEEVAPCLR